MIGKKHEKTQFDVLWCIGTVVSKVTKRLRVSLQIYDWVHTIRAIFVDLILKLNKFKNTSKFTKLKNIKIQKFKFQTLLGFKFVESLKLDPFNIKL